MTSIRVGQSQVGSASDIETCPVCDGRIPGSDGGFAFLSGGALRQIDGETAIPSDDLLGFFNVGKHGAHSGHADEPSTCLHLVVDAPEGQFELSFCSTDCLRRFLNGVVDELEVRLRTRTSGA